MKKYLFIIPLLIFGSVCISAQKTFIFKGDSKLYDVKARVESCEEEEGEQTTCNSKGVFYLMKKNQAQPLQTFEMEETYLSVYGKRVKKGDVTEIFNKEHTGVYFLDYNFDGFEDLAVSNGYNLPYGGVSYDVFLYSKRTGKFIKNKILSELETENMIVDVKKKERIIETYNKSGCCWHEKARYRFVNNRLQKFYVFTEDALGGGKYVELTTGRLVKGKWRTTTRRVLLEKYYKD